MLSVNGDVNLGLDSVIASERKDPDTGRPL